MSDLIAIIGSGAGMAAPAQKGVGGGRAALPPAPQMPPTTGAQASGPASGLGGRGGGRPSPITPQPAYTGPSLGRGRTHLPSPPAGKRGAVGWGEPCPASSGEDSLFAAKFFPGLFGSSDGAHRIPPTCCHTPQQRLGSPQGMGLVPKQPQERGEASGEQALGWARA